MKRNKLDLFVYELDFNKKMCDGNLDFEDMVEKLLYLNEEEREKEITKMDHETQEKVRKLKDGGIL